MNTTTTDFKSDQKRYERVREAYASKGVAVAKLLHAQDLQTEKLELFIRGLKHEKSLQVFGRNKGDDQFKLIVEYPFCELSGELGPKRKQGDWQVPEGFYHIDRFNPVSSFHLSLGINYPNASDKKRKTATDPGGDIFIHGNCVTIGCIPITDALIKELYIMTVEARNNGQTQIPVHIFPFDMSKHSIESMTEDVEMASFWQELKPGFDAFANTKKVPAVSISSSGAYRL